VTGAGAGVFLRGGFGPWRLLLPVLLAVATVSALFVTQRFDMRQRALEADVLAARQAIAALGVAQARAALGSSAGFEALEAAREVLPRVAALLEEGALDPAAVVANVSGLREALLHALEAADAVLETAPDVLALAGAAERLQSVAAGLLVSSDELVEVLIADEGKPAQLRAAARQLMLVQRISTSLRRLLDADAQLLAAADRLGRDALVFGEVATALLNGNPELGLERVESAEGREVLTVIGRDFRMLARAVEAVMAGAAARGALASQSQRLADALVVLRGELARFGGAVSARSAQRLVTPLQALQLAGLTLLALVTALVLSVAERAALRRRWQAERDEEAARAEEASGEREALAGELERLAGDISRIADGDLGLRAYSAGYGRDAGFGVPHLGIARAGLDRIRQQLRERGDDGILLARNGQLVVEVAGRLQDLVRRHAEQTETAGHMTHGMAAALESLRAESERVTDAARRSGVSADAAGEALGETLDELEAVQAGIEQCAERVRGLEVVTRELRAVRTLVEDVGELGKMLSLNVAIQASVDGAASRSLSAVSDEVQRLATRARSAVTQVEAIHDELCAEADRAASTVKESVWRARSAAERARGAGGRLHELSGAAHHLADLSQALDRAQRDHALQVTDVVRAITALHALTRELSEQVDATADSAQSFGALAAGVERRLSAPPPEPVIELPHRDDGPARGAPVEARAHDADEVHGPRRLIDAGP
jgi:twitching motility protein PilJ